MEISTPQKIKLLKLMELLRENSDEDHPLKTNVLCTMLKNAGISCDRRTLSRDIATLNECGYEIFSTMQGKLRAIGVSNFYPDRLIDLCQFAEIAPMVNQVETHVFQRQRTAHEYMKKYGVQHEAWGPFAEGKKNCFTNPVLVEIGEKYGKTAAQTALRFLIQSDVVVIPKSTHKERMEQNLDVFDFSLSEADMEAIRTLDEGKSLFFDHYDPSTVEMLTNMGKTRIV